MKLYIGNISTKGMFKNGMMTRIFRHERKLGESGENYIMRSSRIYVFQQTLLGCSNHGRLRGGAQGKYMHREMRNANEIQPKILDGRNYSKT
jgi:hypothetical protein